MRRRHFMACGAAGAVCLTLQGLLWARPARTISHGRLTAEAHHVLRTVARVVVDGMLPGTPAMREQALQGLASHLDQMVSGLPAAARAELAQLLSVAASVPGRRILVGLAPTWADATPQQVARALQSMRRSRFRMRQQAYQGLRELICGAYFAAPLSWPDLGYPGPLAPQQAAAV